MSLHEEKIGRQIIIDLEVKGSTTLNTCWRFRRPHGYVGRRDVCDQRRRGTVHEDIADVVEQLLGPVLRGLEIEQLRVLVDEAGVDCRAQKLGVLQNVQ